MRLVIFDMDGTLIDSEALIVDTVNSAFRDANEALPDVQAIRAVSGITARDAIVYLAPNADAARVDVLLEGFSTHYRRNAGQAREPMFAGALEALDRLQADPETILAIATDKAYSDAVTLLERHGIVGRFNSIETPTHNRGKPDPQMIETAMSKAGAERHQPVMLGDTTHDMKTAKAGGVKAVGVAWGYHQPVDLRAAGADVVIERFEQLDGAIDAVLGARHA